MYKLKETAKPPSPPIALADAKLYLKIDHSADDSVIEGLIDAAREIAENFTGLALIERGMSLLLDKWPQMDAHGNAWWDGVREGALSVTSKTPLILPMPPLSQVSDIMVYNASGEASAIDAGQYFVDTGIPGRIIFNEATPLPEPSQLASGIEIRFTAGYGPDPGDIPASLRQGILQLVAHLYENRGDTAETALLKSGASALFQPYRRMRMK